MAGRGIIKGYMETFTDDKYIHWSSLLWCFHGCACMSKLNKNYVQVIVYQLYSNKKLFKKISARTSLKSLLPNEEAIHHGPECSHIFLQVCQQWEALVALYPGHLSVARFASVASSLERWSNFFSTQRAGLLTAYSKSGRFSQLKRDKLTAYLPLNCISLWDLEVGGAKKQRCQCSRSLVCWVIKSFCSDPGVSCLLTISRALWQATLSK